MKQDTTNPIDSELEQKIDEIVGTFISLKFDIDTDEFSDGTLERWNNMKTELLTLITSHDKEIDRQARIDRTNDYILHLQLFHNALCQIADGEETAETWIKWNAKDLRNLGKELDRLLSLKDSEVKDEHK